MYGVWLHDCMKLPCYNHKAYAGLPQGALLGQDAAGQDGSQLAMLADLPSDNPKLESILRQQLLREDDDRQMELLMARLDAMRTEKPPRTAEADRPVQERSSSRSRSRARSSTPTGVRRVVSDNGRSRDLIAAYIGSNARPQRSSSVQRRQSVQ